MSVNDKERLEVLDKTVEGGKADMGRVFRLGESERRRVGDQDVQLAPVAHTLQPDAKFKVEGAPSHLRL
jgi:hypothetical protein